MSLHRVAVAALLLAPLAHAQTSGTMGIAPAPVLKDMAAPQPAPAIQPAPSITVAPPAATTPPLTAKPPEAPAYQLDRPAGSVTFGDGVRGRVPPAGAGNVPGSYRAGAGAPPKPVKAPDNAANPARTWLTPLDDPRARKPGDRGGDNAQMNSTRTQSASQQQSQQRSATSNIIKQQSEAQDKLIQKIRN